jgi:hypothetical protein
MAGDVADRVACDVVDDVVGDMYYSNTLLHVNKCRNNIISTFFFVCTNIDTLYSNDSLHHITYIDAFIHTFISCIDPLIESFNI